MIPVLFPAATAPCIWSQCYQPNCCSSQAEIALKHNALGWIERRWRHAKLGLGIESGTEFQIGRRMIAHRQQVTEEALQCALRPHCASAIDAHQFVYRAGATHVGVRHFIQALRSALIRDRLVLPAGERENPSRSHPPASLRPPLRSTRAQEGDADAGFWATGGPP